MDRNDLYNSLGDEKPDLTIGSLANDWFFLDQMALRAGDAGRL